MTRKIDQVAALFSTQGASKTTEPSNDQPVADPVDVDAVADDASFDDFDPTDDIEPGDGGAESAEPEPFTLTPIEEMPPEAQEYYKSMQGDYQRKTKELAEQRREVEGMKKDAELFRQMMENPQKLRQFVDSMTPDGAQTQAGQESTQSTGSFGPDYFAKHSDLNPSEIWEEKDLAGIESVVYNVLREKIEPLIGSIQPHLRYIEQDYVAKQQQQWTNLESQYPGIESHKSRIQELTQMGLTLEEAARAVGAEKAPQPKQQPAQKKQVAKQRERPTTLTKPTVHSSSNSSGTGKSFRDAVKEFWTPDHLG